MHKIVFFSHSGNVSDEEVMDRDTIENGTIIKADCYVWYVYFECFTSITHGHIIMHWMVCMIQTQDNHF